jgi:hypothetical protein
MQFAIGVTVLECSSVKHSHDPLGVKAYASWTTQCQVFKCDVEISHAWRKQGDSS